ncbi:MAG: DMT family transporter [Syntrophobacterales bacterium]|nr:DMT family transporter [Syntrophobacterales bacterium]
MRKAITGRGIRNIKLRFWLALMRKTGFEQRGQRLMADFLLVMTAFFWGITFVVVKEAIRSTGVFVFLSQRFTLAAILMAAICLLLRRPFKIELLPRGAIMGFFLFGGYAFQTAALLYTSASNAAFLTGLNVLLLPILGTFFYGYHVSRYTFLGVLLAAVGLYLLSTQGGTLNPNKGDLLAGICAVSVALHVIYTGKYAGSGDVFWLTAIQLGVVALLSALVSAFIGDRILVWHQEIAWALAITVIFATVFAFLVQTSMQRFTSPTRTALIFCLEPVFAAIYAYYAAGERLGMPGFVGALMILAGMILSEIEASGLPEK